MRWSGGPAHGCEQLDGTGNTVVGNIVVVVVERLFYRFTDDLKAGEVHHHID